MHSSKDVERSSRETRAARLKSLGSFIWQDRARVLAAADRGDARQHVVECELRGASMSGAIPAGSRIRIALRGPPYHRGEVVAFITDTNLVVHRIVYLQRRGLRRHSPEFMITRGDAMLLPDAPINTRFVLGRVVEMCVGAEWRAINGQAKLPGRERLLAALIVVGIAFLLNVRLPLARRFTEWLHATDRRWSWTRTLLY
jgi:hypothetical protein